MDKECITDKDDCDHYEATDEREDDQVLREFYALTYEPAVLVGPSGSSPTKAGSTRRERKPFTFSPTPPAPAAPSPASRYELDAPKSQSQATTGPSVAQVPGTTESLAASTTLTREIMDALLPPRTWQDSRGKWQRVARMTPATRTEVQSFQTALDKLLILRQARSSAICPVREQLFLHAFDELLREVALECPERGLLLLRVRDELRLTVEAYQTLYYNSIAYGRVKAVQADVGLAEMNEVYDKLASRRQELLAEKKSLELRLTGIETQAEDQQRMREMQHEQTMAFLHQQHEELQAFHVEMTKQF